MEVSKVVKSRDEIERAKEDVVGGLRDRLWKEVWRDELEIEGVMVSVMEVPGGYKVTAEI